MTRFSRYLAKVGGRRSEGGISALELTLVLPVLIVLIAAVVDLGLALRRYQIVSEAAKFAAKQTAADSASPNANNSAWLCDDLRAKAEAYANDYLASNGITIADFQKESKAEVCSVSASAPLSSLPVVRVTLQKDSGCVLCWKDYLLPPLRSQSVFSLISECTGLSKCP